MLSLSASLIILVVAPLLVRAANTTSKAFCLLDGFVVVAIVGLVANHILPHSIEAVGSIAIVIALLGLLGPTIFEHVSHKSTKQTHLFIDSIAIIGLIIHALLDGIVLSTNQGDDAHLLAMVIALHRLPVAVTIWGILRPYRKSFAIAALAGIGLATCIGYLLGSWGQTILEAHYIHVFQAFIAGSLLHILFHNHRVRSPHKHPFAESIGGIVALIALFVLFVDETSFHTTSTPVIDINIFISLATQSAPALLIAFSLIGFFQIIVPHASLAWIKKGTPLTQSIRGMTFGLPLPICSCGIIPIYHFLISKGIPASAALAFLVATPEIGLDAILISIPLLGADLTVFRIIAAAVTAVTIGWFLGRKISTNTTVLSSINNPFPQTNQQSWRTKLRQGFRFGFVDLVDSTIPWLILGLIIAAAVTPLFETGWMNRLPIGIDVLLFALLGIPAYVCASGTTPLAAAFIFNGVSPGAAIAFMLTGPATNITTFGVLSRLHGKKLALMFGFSVCFFAILTGILTNSFLDRDSIPSYLEIQESPEPYMMVALGILGIIVFLSFLRQGPRGFLRQILYPIDIDDNDNEICCDSD